MVCKRLLRESRFAEIWNEPNDCYRLNTFHDGYSYWDTDEKLTIAYTYIKNGIPYKLRIHGYSEHILLQFINFYSVEPYTYHLYMIDMSITYSSMIKPFTYDFIQTCNPSILPLCVKFLGHSVVKAIIYEDLDEETEYAITKQMQCRGLNVKSAKK